RGREPAIGKVVTVPAETLMRVSGEEPTTWKFPAGPPGRWSRYMYGEGLIVRSARYTSNGSASHSRSNRPLRTTCSHVPRAISRLTSRTDSSYSPWEVRIVRGTVTGRWVLATAGVGSVRP